MNLRVLPTRAHFSLFALLLSSCAASLASREVAVGTPVTLAPNDTVNIRGTQIQVQFLGIASDSRCPRESTCVWAGEVVASVSVRDGGPAVTHEIRVTDTLALSAHRLVCESVQPDRIKEGKIPADTYRITVRVD